MGGYRFLMKRFIGGVHTALIDLLISPHVQLHLPNNDFAMLHSMTGYGRAEQTLADKTYLVEVRSLNGKQFDLRLFFTKFLDRTSNF